MVLTHEKYLFSAEYFNFKSQLGQNIGIDTTQSLMAFSGWKSLLLPVSSNYAAVEAAREILANSAKIHPENCRKMPSLADIHI